MKFLEYKLHRDNSGNMIIPNFVENGGNWFNPADHTMVFADKGETEYYVPDTLTSYDLAGLQARVRGINAATGSVDENGQPFSDADSDAAVAEWAGRQ